MALIAAFQSPVYLTYKHYTPRKMRMGSGDGSNNEEIQMLYRSPNIVSVIKSRILRWAGHVGQWKKVGVLSKC